MDWRYHLLKRTGYSFSRKNTSGKTLEFLGTSGVGKTSLFNHSMIKLKDRWFFAYHLEFFKRKIPPQDIDGFLMRILQARIDNLKNSDAVCPWHSLLDLKLSVRVMHETMLIVNNAHPRGFAFDEGLFRHFAAELLESGEDFPEQLWKDRAFVYLRARNSETALSRVRSRTRSLAKIERQRDRTDDQILAKIANDQEIFQSIVDRAIAKGCPVLVIEAEDPFQDSVKKVLAFEKSLGRMFETQGNKCKQIPTYSQ